VEKKNQCKCLSSIWTELVKSNSFKAFMNNGIIGGVGRKSVSSEQKHFTFSCSNFRKLITKTEYNFFCV